MLDQMFASLTAGTGWSYSAGVWTKTAGTAAAISQAVTLTAGKMYAVFFDCTRSAGTLAARFTGGTTLTGFAVNEAIAGNGATPITGVDGRVTSHVAAMNDGSGNLAAAFNTAGDHVHPNTWGRWQIAQAWRAQLVADGLI